MAFIAKYKSIVGGLPVERTWTFESEKIVSILDKVKSNIGDLITLEASGIELNHIKIVYRNNNTSTIPLPTTKNDTVIWYGDIAKTILANL